MDYNSDNILLKLVECSAKMSEIIERHNNDISDHEARIRAIEMTPGNSFKKFISIIVTACVSALVGGVIGGVI